MALSAAGSSGPEILAENREGRLLALLADCAARMLGAADPLAMIDYLFETIRAEVRLDAYFHYGIDAEGMLVLEAYGGLSPEQAQAARRLRFGQAVCGRVARDRTPCVVADVQTSPDPETDFIRDIGLDSYACTPLIYGQVLLGTLGFGRRGPDRFTEVELRFLRTMCSYVAVAKNRMIVEAELLESLGARDALVREQARLLERVSADAPESGVAAVASTLAHEMAQPLTAASNYIAMVEMALRGTGGADVLQRLAQARAQITRSSQIITRARALLEHGAVQTERVDIRHAFAEAIELVGAARDAPLPPVEIHVAERAGTIRGDHVQIVQVLANLLRNAAQATRAVERPRLSLSATVEGAMIVLAVEDNGPGFTGGAPVTGCSTTGGLGLGLSICRRIAEGHGGTLRLGSTSGGGARVAFCLPGLPPAATDIRPG